MSYKELISNPIEYLEEILHELSPEIEIVKTRDDSSDIEQIKIKGNKIKIYTVRQFYPKSMMFIPEWEKNVIVIADYITPKAKELLKEKRINYLDGAGNIILKLPNLIIAIDDKKNQPVSEHQKYSHRAFTKSGAAVIFQFLQDPNLINAPQRTIAEYSNVSLGTIPKVFDQLEAEGYIAKLNNKERVIKDNKELLDKWVEVFNDKLLPSLHLQNCKYGNDHEIDFYHEAQMHEDTQWGGEPGAAKLTEYLIPEKISIFTELPKNELIKRYRLLPDPHGPIVVYKKFWKHTTAQNETVHPIIIYAMLLGDGDSRNIETAQMIYRNFIEPNLQ